VLDVELLDVPPLAPVPPLLVAQPPAAFEPDEVVLLSPLLHAAPTNTNDTKIPMPHTTRVLRMGAT